jgi:hypothetical protein
MDTHTHRAVIADDGEYYIELDGNHAPNDAPGFLQRRCYIGVITPDGYECVGSFGRNEQGLWQASIDAPYDEATGTDRRTLGQFTERMNAIVALWGRRREAYCRHKDR